MTTPPSATPMNPSTIGWILGFLGAYLVVATLLSWSVWNARPVADPSAALGTPGPADTLLAIDSVTPGAIFRGEEAGLLVYGLGFDTLTAVLVNGDTAATARYLSTGMMYLESSEEPDGPRRLAISARGAGPTPVTSNVAVVLAADPGRTTVVWRYWLLGTRVREISQEARFLLLTLLVGSLGGTLASFKSLADYRGQDRLFRSWTIHYLVAPFVAGFIALFLYFAIRAGFLSGTTVTIDGTAVPWGLLAISALSGLFYDRTFTKLREVFRTLLSAEDNRVGKLDPREEPDDEGGEADGAGEGDDGEGDDGEGDDGGGDDAPSPPPVIATTSLPAATVGEPYEATLEAEETPATLSWSVTPELPGGLELHPGTGVVSGTPVEATAKRTYVFTAENLEGGKASASLELEVTA